MPYALVIFDFDGTLADSASWFHGVFNGVARRYRFREVEGGDVAYLRGQDARAVLRFLGVPRWKLPFIAAHMRGLMARDRARIALFPGVRVLLRSLHEAGVKLAIVSSNSRSNVEHILGAESAALIDVYGCGTSMFGKSARFRRVLRRAGVLRVETIAIGDEVRDMEAAWEVGVACGAVAWGYADPEKLEGSGPTILFRRVDEIGVHVLSAGVGSDRPIVPLTSCAAPD